MLATKSSFSLCLEASRRGCGNVTPADGEWRRMRQGEGTSQRRAASGRYGWVALSVAGVDGREKHVTEDIAV
uniref:Uncharacterized protein n=1 Tax=Oryza nivara TaxID=4536 RepID=A0A0E0II43_ORYNI